MIKFKLIEDEELFRKVVSLKVTEEQKKFVASNLYSLAEAGFHKNAKPFAIMNDDELIGFIMFDWNITVRCAYIWRLMISPIYQNKGYGRKAIEIAIKMMKEDPDIDFTAIDYERDNEVAKHLYSSFGFVVDVDDPEDDQVYLKLKIKEIPEVGMELYDEDELNEAIEILNKNKIIKYSIDDLKSMNLTKRLIRLTIFGDTIGIIIDDKIILNENNQQYYHDACEKYKTRKDLIC